ncbi:transmembrane E3 ubiquitin-protein ligase FLY2 isoform X3 [Physcomitrium patens]|uniref:RING-type E3 ubiquitin transferase n=1 Tax=Physcomitrium patens TaxID=3218 RepID=A0A2K1J0F4_PHYPA|nr:uncharacterized protein LOC112295548 isoform X3 [Physcomitrium patens]PNR35004.1 hypothetical protein PHYPA_022903 [Physcomitrium patens]|eukprot:XP_024403076.1 uncharacterized protein LOC112295548 isoform X3 [Physcomitrella patens]
MRLLRGPAVDEVGKFGRRASKPRAEAMLSRDGTEPVVTEQVEASSVRRPEVQRDEAGRNCGINRAIVITLWITTIYLLPGVATGYRPLKEKVLSFEESSWHERLFAEGSGVQLGPYSVLNISGTYKGTWSLRSGNYASKFPVFQKTSGNIVFELTSSATDISGVHFVQGEVVLRDGVYISDGDLQMKMEGVYVWPFRQLRMVLSSAVDSEMNRGDDFIQSSPYHLLGMFSSQVAQDTPRNYVRHNKKNSNIMEMGRTCKIQLITQISTSVSDHKYGEHERQVCEMQGLVEGPSMGDEQGECFSPLVVNATSVNVALYYNKAVNYTLMVTFISFLQVLFLIRQMEHSNTQSGAAKVSLMMIGQQAIMDAYLCLLHLTAGILVESLFNAFATAAFFKFVIFSIFEMRYLLAIWKSRRPVSSGEGWETMRRELSVLYSRFYGFLLGGILIMYELHNMLRYIVFFFYSFWIPQIVANVVRDSRKSLHPHYIVGITVTRLAIPLYVFGCPNNFIRIEANVRWCVGLTTFLGAQAAILLLQHYCGARCFIPRQLLPEKYSYFRRVDRVNEQLGGEENAPIDCVICMAAVDVSQRCNDCMVTPCDHFFHTGCLQRWMDIKMECPTCRRPLPPI